MVELNSKYKEDLMFMITKYEETFVAPYYCFSKQELIDYINEYLSKTTIKNDNDFIYFLKTIIKKLNGTLDCHTTVRGKHQFIPIMLKMFEDGIYVVKTNGNNDDLLYSKLESINGISYQELIKEMESIISFGTEGWRKSCIENGLCELNTLLSLPSINSEKKKVNLVFTTLNGEKRILEFKDGDETEELVPHKENCSFEVIDNTIHYIYNSCSREDSEKLISTIEQMKEIISTGRIKDFILDLRDNSGGSSAVIKPLIEFLSSQKLNLYTFVNRNTFSSGMFALEDMIKLGTTTIGEGVGSTLNGFGNLDGIYELPNTKFSLRIATKYFPKDGGAITSQDDYKEQVTRKDLEPIFYTPDIVVTEKIQDYIEGRDRYMEKFMEIKDKNIVEYEK